MSTKGNEGYLSLSTEQQTRYRFKLEALGVNVDAALKRKLSTRREGGQVTLSADPQRSAIPPAPVLVTDVEMLKLHGGVPDREFTHGNLKEDHIQYPQPWSAKDNSVLSRAKGIDQLRRLLTPEQRHDIRKALRAYIIGNSNKVKSYEAVINAFHFPQVAYVFAGDTLCVATGSTVTIAPPQGDNTPYSQQNPYLVQFASVCIEYGGQILFQVPTQLTVTGTMTRLPQGQQCTGCD